MLGKGGFHPCKPLSFNGRVSFYVSVHLHSISLFSSALAL
jgi:hypothetical protein